MEQFNQVREEEFKRRNHLLDSFEDNGIEKSISTEEFNQKYGQDHEIFTMEKINSFVAGATKEGATDEVVKSIEDQLKTLSKVIVKSEDGYSAMYVREIQKSEDAETPEGEESSETETEEEAPETEATAEETSTEVEETPEETETETEEESTESTEE